MLSLRSESKTDLEYVILYDDNLFFFSIVCDN